MDTAYNALLVTPMIDEPTAAAGQIAHVAIKHGDGGGRLFHELTQALFALTKRFSRFLLCSEVTNDF